MLESTEYSKFLLACLQNMTDTFIRGNNEFLLVYLQVRTGIYFRENQFMLVCLQIRTGIYVKT